HRHQAHAPAPGDGAISGPRARHEPSARAGAEPDLSRSPDPSLTRPGGRLSPPRLPGLKKCNVEPKAGSIPAVPQACHHLDATSVAEERGWPAEGTTVPAATSIPGLRARGRCGSRSTRIPP